MSRQIQIRRGSAAEHSNFTGAIGEITMDTTNKTLRVHDGVTPGGKEIMSMDKFYSNMTNCITHIPQDINLTLSGGTLTLKAGSKCYLKTDTTSPSVSITSDLTTTQTTNGNYFVFYNGSGLTTALTNAYDYSSLPDTYSLPLAVVSVSNGAIFSVNQVFNGFGFIGAKVFVLPGVKALVPDGRNVDGTLKNTAITITSVNVKDAYNSKFMMDSVGITPANSTNYAEQNTQPSFTNGDWYNPSENIMYRISSGVATKTNRLCAITVFAPGGGIQTVSGIKPKYVFRGLGDCDSYLISGWSMPSNKSESLTLGASDATYKAPGNGWFYLEATVPTSGFAIRFVATDGTARKAQVRAISGNQFCVVPLYPATAGEVVQVHYDGTLTNVVFKFIYADGEK